MQKTEAFFGLALQRVPVGAHGFQQMKGADNVGLDEFARAVNGAINMTLGGKVDDSAWAVLGQ